MKVCGFSFIRNAIKYDYPIVEAIQSILPICDEFIVAVGSSDDDTLGLIQNISAEKIKIVETTWDDTQRKDGKVLAIETNKAFKNIPKDADWCFYIQGDEVIHEKYLPAIKKGMEKHQENKLVDGLLFKYLHFYGSYDYVGDSSQWYNHEIRVVKNNPKIYSYKDAQGFRKNDNEKLDVVEIDAFVYHYGWVKDPKSMQEKQLNFNKFWHDDKWIEEKVEMVSEYEYEKHVSLLKKFEDNHPKVMQERINKINWKFEHDISLNKKSLKDLIKRALCKIGINTYYTNYNKIKIK